MSFIADNIVAYYTSGRVGDGEAQFNEQHDQTQQISDLESLELNYTGKGFLFPLNLMATSDADLCSTRKVDKQVKMISSHQSDLEGHCFTLYQF